MANILHTFSTQVIRAIEDTCQEAEFHTIVCNADDDPDKERKYIEMLRAKQVDGIILLPTGDNATLYNEMLKEGYPIVFVDRTVPDVPIPSMLLDNEKASGIGVQHFIDRGYTKIGIITNVIRNVTPRMERINGYKNTMNANGLDIRDDYIKSLEVNRIREGVHDLLSLDDPPEAILAGNDLTLIEILKYVKENHVRIPEDLAIIGIDDVSFAGFFEPGLTIVAQPTFEIGKKAAEFLLNKIQKKEDQDEGLVFRFDPKLIIRESC